MIVTYVKMELISGCEKRRRNGKEMKIGFLGRAVAQQNRISLKRTKNKYWLSCQQVDIEISTKSGSCLHVE
jgi:hypothetical protein